jgi:hypothetical protein
MATPPMPDDVRAFVEGPLKEFLRPHRRPTGPKIGGRRKLDLLQAAGRVIPGDTLRIENGDRRRDLVVMRRTGTQIELEDGSTITFT